MKRSVNSLVGYTIKAKDGELGKVSEFYFDDHTWSIRYLVVETGNWLNERKVLIPHSALGRTDWESQTFQVNLTMEQIRNSPDFETQKTVSRQHEIELYTHYGLPVYWDSVFNDGFVGMGPYIPILVTEPVKEEKKSAKNPPDDPHLRSTNSVEGYFIHANDGEIGHVEDYIVDDEKWNIRYMIVDTTNWLPGRKVLILPRWIKRIDWAESKVYVNLSLESIKNSPEFDPSQPVDKIAERELFDHYGDSLEPW
ncbi:MAG: PRC-barrel domain-containing protein [Ignavibacteria bacterium]|nr:PRC-barrel domain-containing protein [Ignavibacteria bacterium]